MKKRIWINVQGLQLNSLLQVLPNQFDNEKHALVSIKIGNAFNINGVRIGSREGDSWFSQNWAMADARFLDVPGLHHGKHKKYPVLDDILAREVFLFCTKRNNEAFRAFVENGGQVPETPFFKPEEWNGKSLRIPVEFIKLRNFHFARLGGHCVFADIQIGSHLIFWRVKIFDGKRIIISNNRIIDPAMNSIIKNMLIKKEAVRETISKVSETENDDTTAEFINAIPNIDIDKNPTPIRFY